MNHTTAALIFLLAVFITATTCPLWAALLTAMVADLALNYFFMAPVGTLRIADPQNVIALFVFFAVSAIASQLSAKARARERDATSRRDELARLFDLSRDILLTTDSRDAIAQLARIVSRRFELEWAAICLPRQSEWDVFESGSLQPPLAPAQLTGGFAGAERSLHFDARSRAYAGHQTLRLGERQVHLVPLRLGTKN